MAGCGLESQMLGIGTPFFDQIVEYAQKGTQARPKGIQGRPKGTQGHPKGAKWTPKGTQGRPKVTQGHPKGSQGHPKWSQVDAKGTQGRPKGSQKVYIFPNSRSTAIGRPLLVFIDMYIQCIYFLLIPEAQRLSTAVEARQDP